MKRMPSYNITMDIYSKCLGAGKGARRPLLRMKAKYFTAPPNQFLEIMERAAGRPRIYR